MKKKSKKARKSKKSRNQQKIKKTQNAQKKQKKQKEVQEVSKSKKYALTVTLLEDMHSGTGSGSAKADAVQAVDREGKPVIPATHLYGLLKQAACELYEYTKDEQIGNLLGKAGRRQFRKLVLQSLRVENHVDTLLWTSSAREYNDGIPERTPATDTLRTVEYVPAGTVFKGKLELRDSKSKDALCRCLKRISHIGSRRTRGSGQVKIELKACGEKRPVMNMPAKTKTRLRLALKNIDPLVIPDTGVPDNVIVSKGYIPGQVLAGALKCWALENDKTAEFLFERRIDVGNALPIPYGEKIENLHDAEVMPFPLNIYSLKGGAGKSAEAKNNIPWWDRQQSPFLGEKGEIDCLNENENENENKKTSDYKRSRGGEFIFRCGEKRWQRYHPPMGIHMRNGELFGEKELFAEEEIAEDTLFLTDLQFDSPETAQGFRDQFAEVLSGNSWLTVGRGGRPVEVVSYLWYEPDKASGEQNMKNDFTLTLESALIARTPSMGFYTALTLEVLGKLVDIEISKEKIEGKNFSESVEVRGFNSASGLPRSPAVAIAMGSAIRVKDEHAAKLFGKLAAGNPLGERTWEGFGRYRLDFQPLDVKAAATASLKQVDIRENSREAILDKAKKLADNLLREKGTNGFPSKSQWNDLRNRIAIAGSKDKIVNILDELSRLETKGGKVWGNVSKEITKSLVLNRYETDKKVRLFVDYITRYCILELKRRGEQL